MASDPAATTPGWHVPDPVLLEPWQYILNVPGKNVRGKLVAAFNTWLQVDANKVAAITEIVRMLHTASLLIDDIEDDSTLRRGVPVAHAIYGIPSTLNTANYVYVLALEKCHQLNEPKATHVFVQELLNLHRGQGQDILWRDTVTCPTEEQYRSMVVDKTGGLFRLAVGLMQAFSKDTTDYAPLLDSLAYYFQVRDDFMNIMSTEYFANKSFCEDLTEGKFSFPIIHAIKTVPSDNRLVRILKQRTRDVTVKQHAVQFMEKCGSLRYTWKKLRVLYEEIVGLIAGLGGHPMLLELIEALHNQITPVAEEEEGQPERGQGEYEVESGADVLVGVRKAGGGGRGGGGGGEGEGGGGGGGGRGGGRGRGDGGGAAEGTEGTGMSSPAAAPASPSGESFNIPGGGSDLSPTTGIKVERLSAGMSAGLMMPRSASTGSDRSSIAEKDMFDTL
jgi:geranylgeranyl diphosphate synthase type 3